MSKSKGQVSIFLIFIFHILFLFFAMVINVGMLVHHKINLQNSVDLAAYYGAMKQSEILGAIAHSNYQIRQSWKLMNFRYHILGGLGRDDHPGNPQNAANPAPDAPTGKASVFCMAHDPLFVTRDNGGVGDQSFCKYTTPTMTIAAMKVPKFVGAIAIHETVAKGIQLAKDRADADFKDGGVRNFRLLTLFVSLYRSDVKNRKLIINELANQLSHSDSDFKDLDGGSVSEGVQKTLFNNLTEDNKSAIYFKFYNSMGHRNCARRDEVNYPPIWLRQITAMPQYIYYDATINENDDDIRYAGGFSQLIDIPKLAYQIVNPTELHFLEFMRDLSHPYQRPDINFFDVVGVEKNPWCLTYTGVTAVTTPSLPFMPSSVKINLTASAYAKAFGGKVGPWYESQWSQSSSMSKGGVKIDATLPIRYEDIAALNSGNAENYKERMPNYARYPGDTTGIISLQAQKAYGQIIYKIASDQQFTYNTAAWLSKTHDLMASQSNLYSGLPIMPSNLDIMAEDVSNEHNAGNVVFRGGKELRELETLAIAPDLFDITYYSIEPNFSALYWRKLKNLFPNAFPRDDFGSAVGKLPITVIDQMTTVGENNFGVNFTQNGLYHVVYKSSPTDDNDPIWGRLLTNWTEKSLLDYSIQTVTTPDELAPKGMFGHCAAPLPKNMQATSSTQGECLTGGRTGYSVKLVSKKYLTRDDLVLGGIGTSGAILNPPPDNFDY